MRSRFDGAIKKLNREGAAEGRLEVIRPPRGDADEEASAPCESRCPSIGLYWLNSFAG
jgi:hypothetical protein